MYPPIAMVTVYERVPRVQEGSCLQKIPKIGQGGYENINRGGVLK